MLLCNRNLVTHIYVTSVFVHHTHQIQHGALGLHAINTDADNLKSTFERTHPSGFSAAAADGTAIPTFCSGNLPKCFLSFPKATVSISPIHILLQARTPSHNNTDGKGNLHLSYKTQLVTIKIGIATITLVYFLDAALNLDGVTTGADAVGGVDIAVVGGVGSRGGIVWPGLWGRGGGRGEEVGLGVVRGCWGGLGGEGRGDVMVVEAIWVLLSPCSFVAARAVRIFEDGDGS
jgi:hypothetical protein